MPPNLITRAKGALFGFKQPPSFLRKSSDGVLTNKELMSLLLNQAGAMGGEVSELSAYENLEVVYRCISVTVNRIKSLPTNVYKMIGKFRPEVFEQFPADMLHKPNPVITGKDLIGQTIGWLLCKGKAYYWRKQEAGKKPTLWILPAHRMTPNQPNKFPPDDYTLSGGGDGYESIVIPRSELICFSFWSPVGLNDSIAPMKASLRTANLDAKASILNQKLFENAGIVSGLLTTSENVDEKDVDKVEAWWEQKYSGVQQAGRVGILTGGWKFEKFGITPVEMQYILGRKLNRENICTAFGIPPAVAGVLEYANYANMNPQMEIFWEFFGLPLIDYIEDVINTFLLPLYRSDIYFAFDTSKVPTLQRMKREAWTTAKEQIAAGVMTPNQYIISETDRAPVPWGDNFYMPLGMIMEGSLLGTEDALYGKGMPSKELIKACRNGVLFKSVVPKSIESEEEKPEDNKPLKRRAYCDKKRLTEEERVYIWRKYAAATDRQEEKFSKETNKLFKDQYRKISEAVKSRADQSGNLTQFHKPEFETIFYSEDWIAYFYRALKPLYASFLKQAGQDVLIDINSPVEFTLNTPAIQHFLGEKNSLTQANYDVKIWWSPLIDYIRNELKLIHLTTMEDVWAAIEAGIIDQQSITEIMQGISGAFQFDTRADRIARTEINTVNNYNAYEQSGVVDGSEWLAVKDGRSRDNHAGSFDSGAGCDGEVVSIGDQFIIPASDNGKVPEERCLFPGDPKLSAANRIYCRCRTIPVLKETIQDMQ
jgi:HK97 family phage portal protein